MQVGKAETLLFGMRALEGVEATPENAGHVCRILTLFAGVLVQVGQFDLGRTSARSRTSGV
jgi:hypothetical protein